MPLGDPAAHQDPVGHDPRERGFGDPDGGAKGGQGVPEREGTGSEHTAGSRTAIDAEAGVSPQESCLLEAVLAAI